MRRVLAATVVLGLVAVVLSPGLGVAVAAHGIAGALNTAFFAAARTEFAPQHACGQVFIWVVTGGDDPAAWPHRPTTRGRGPLCHDRPRHRSAMAA